MIENFLAGTAALFGDPITIKSAAVPARKFSIIRTNPDLEHVLQLGVHAEHKRAEIIEW